MRRVVWAVAPYWILLGVGIMLIALDPSCMVWPSPMWER